MSSHALTNVKTLPAQGTTLIAMRNTLNIRPKTPSDPRPSYAAVYATP